MTTYAQITNGQIIREAPAPAAPGYGPDGAWHDYTNPAEVAAYLADGGWVAVTEPATAKPADTATTYYVREVALVDGAPVASWVAKTKSAEQQAAEAEAKAKLTNLEARIAKIEAAIWPPPGTPADTTGIKSFTDWGGVVPPGALVLDGGKVYRNKTTVPLTTAPTAMPGGPTQWTHLWEPITPTGTGGGGTTPAAWDPNGKAHKIGDLVTYNGKTYRCIQAHTSQVGWTPTAVASLWTLA